VFSVCNLLKCVACVVSLALAGCGAANFRSGMSTALLPSAEDVSFGSVTIGDVAKSAVSISNAGTAVVEISQISFSDTEFSINSQPSLPLIVAPGQSVNLSLKFNPSSVGSADGRLTVSTESGLSAQVKLHGNGSAPLASIGCAMASISGAGTDNCTVTLNSNAPSGGTVINLTSNNAFVSVPSSVTVQAGALSASFSAQVSAVTSLQQATLTASATKNSVSTSIQLNPYVATLVAGPSLNLGKVPVGSSTSQSLTLTSTGSAAVTVTSATVAGAGFQVTGAAFPLTINPGQSATLPVHFAPASAGVLAGQLSIASNSSTGPATVALSGTGVAMLASLSCSAASITGAGSDSCTVGLNTPAPAGGLQVSLSSNNTSLSVPSSVVVAQGNSSASFSAAANSLTSAQSATISAALSGLTQSFTIQLIAPAPGLSASVSTLNFGTTAVGTSSTQSVTLTSNGSGPVTISGAVSTASGFSVLGASTPITLSPGQATTLMVQFAPTISGTSTGSLAITSNASAGTPAVALSGTGTPVLSSLQCGTQAYTGVGTDSCSVTLNASALTGGFALNLQSNNAAVTLPASLIVPAGASSASFSASVSSVSTAQTAVISASAGALTRTFSIQLNTSVAILGVSTSSIAFGAVQVGATPSQTLTLSSTGSSAVTVNSAAVSGPGFSLSGAAFPITLNQGQTATLTIQYAPSSAGATTGQVTISSNSSTGSTTSISLSGTGNAILGSLNCTNNSLTGANTDGCTATLNTAAPSGGVAVSLGSSNSALTVPASIMIAAGSTSAGFTATSTAVSTAQTATITASANGSSKTFGVQLNASAATLTASSTTVAFGTVNVGRTAASSVTLTSSGNSPVTISSISAGGSGFTASGITTPLTLNPGQTATLTLSFYPDHSGTFTGTVTIASNSSTGNLAINTSGSGVPVLGGMTCTKQAFSGSGTDSCLVSLNGAATSSGYLVNLSSNSNAVTVPASLTVPSGQTSASFTATISGVTSSQTATLTATSGSVQMSYGLSLTPGVAALSVNASSVPFGNVEIGSVSTQTVTLTSTGGVAVTISSIALTGTGFMASGVSTPLTINPGQSANLNLVFSPKTSGNFTGQITITSNASNGTITFPLSGAGYGHSVALNWYAPASSPDLVVGYNVYRAPIGGTVTYTKINSTPVALTSFKDGAVTPGTTYDYYVTSVDGVGVESAPSNISRAQIPAP
jgi:hypothetical protein